MPERRLQVNPSFSESAEFDWSQFFPEWHRRAACAGATWIEFFPSRARFSDNHGSDAKAVCLTCPVLIECLTGAVERHEDYGLWGGAGGGKLRYLRRLWAKRPHVESGPVEGCECGWCTALAGWREELRLELASIGGAARAAPVINRNGPGARHGLRVSYSKGCRCEGSEGGSCLWAATKLAQLIARLGMDTAEFWIRHAGDGSYEERKQRVDGAAQATIEVAVGNLLGLLHPRQEPTSADSGLVHAVPPRFISGDQLAERWSISRRSVERMVAAGQLAPLRLGPSGGVMRFDLEDIERLEADRKAAA